MSSFEVHLFYQLEPTAVPEYDYSRILNNLSKLKKSAMTKQLIDLHTQAVEILNRRAYVLEMKDSQERKDKLAHLTEEYLIVMKAITTLNLTN